MASMNPLFARYGFDTEYDTLDRFLKLIYRSYDENEFELRVHYAKAPRVTIGGIDRFFILQQTDVLEPKRIIAIDAPGTAVHMSIVDTRNEPDERMRWIEISDERLPFVANDDSDSLKMRRQLVHKENSEDKYGFCVYRHFIVQDSSQDEWDKSPKRVVMMPLYIDGCVPFYSNWNFGYPSYETAVSTAKIMLTSGRLWNSYMTCRTFKPSKVFVVRYLKGEGEIYGLASADFGSEQHFLHLISETGLIEDGYHPGFFYSPDLLYIDESTFKEKDDAMLKFGDFIIESIVEDSSEYVLRSISDFKDYYGELIMTDMMRLFEDIRFMKMFNSKQEACK